MEFLSTHWLDIVTTVLGLAYILLEYKASIWMWAVGFAMQALGIVLYYQKGLYADCGMEFYYLSMTVYGYWKWKTHPQPLSVEGGGIKSLLPSLNRERLGVGLFIIAAIWAAIYWLLVTFTNSNVPLADSFTTALSIVGIWALAHKYLEQWFIWIVVDVVTSVLYFYKDIPFKASLYALYVIIAIFGYIKWRKMINIS
jgi:nicotinamide mononucleotide transporter